MKKKPSTKICRILSTELIFDNFRQIFVIAQYRSDELQHHLHQTYQFDHFGSGCIDVLTPQEDELVAQWAATPYVAIEPFIKPSA